jgi:hypothetical protein
MMKYEEVIPLKKKSELFDIVSSVGKAKIRQEV